MLGSSKRLFQIPNLILQLVPPGLHPELIAFFDLKSQNKNCFSGLAPNPDLALPVSSGGLQTSITRPGLSQKIVAFSNKLNSGHNKINITER